MESAILGYDSRLQPLPIPIQSVAVLPNHKGFRRGKSRAKRKTAFTLERQDVVYGIGSPAAIVRLWNRKRGRRALVLIRPVINQTSQSDRPN